MNDNNYPKLHNAAWPGVVGKGSDSEPFISLDTMLDLTAAAEVDGQKFDGIDLFLYDPHVNIDVSDDGVKEIADKVAARNLKVGSVVAPVWPDIGGGSAMGSKEERSKFLGQVRKACHINKTLDDLGVRSQGVIRIDSATDLDTWAKNPEDRKLITETFREACDIASGYGEKLAAEGEICWGGMQSCKEMLETLESIDRPNIGFQADMSHTLMYLLGYNKPEDRILAEDFDWEDREAFKEGLKKMTDALRPWTIDFHVAQNDGSVFGSGSHEKTGRHCLADDPNGKIDIPNDAGLWLRDENGEVTKAFKHICWDGCMFPNEVMTKPKIWNDILSAMVKVRESHGWYEAE
ncbi:MAG: TIM barrel protein [Balneolales bacterium]